MDGWTGGWTNGWADAWLDQAPLSLSQWPGIICESNDPPPNSFTRPSSIIPQSTQLITNPTPKSDHQFKMLIIIILTLPKAVPHQLLSTFCSSRSSAMWRLPEGFNPDIYGRPCRFASTLIISHHRPHSTNCRLPSPDHVCFTISALSNHNNLVKGCI